MLIDVSKFFEFEAADIRYSFDKEIYYDVLLTSKSTGEIMTFTFDETHFDELLKQMEQNVNAKYCRLYDIPRIINYGEF